LETLGTLMAKARKKAAKKQSLFVRTPPTIAKTAEEVRWLSVLGARHNNLKNIDVHFPLGRFVAVTGVSGSGKSSLVNDILREALARDLNMATTAVPGDYDKIVGIEHLDKIIDIDQTPIGRTPRSNPGTYIKVFDQIRDLFTKLPESKTRGYKAGRFSFNVPGGRCEACEGNGANKLGMDFLADVWVTCPLCQGRRFNRETLQIRYREKNIHEILEMDVQEAVDHFQNLPRIHDMLRTLHDVGLDYIKIGQPSPTLSGGEAQRVKLAKELCKRSTGRTMYVLDEPTTGLHFEDVRKLLAVLHGFVDAGNTVVVIEHNLDVVKTADWVIDLGPEGGGRGGEIIIEGTPEQVSKCDRSHTGRSLREVLNPKRISATTAVPLAPAVKRLTHIEIEGAQQHNLKDVSLQLPLHEMTVFCGPSGSGKSSLAIDTLYAEGQRRYVESLSSYARQFLGQMQKPKVEKVVGLAPAICIEQKSAGKSPRSTVGTVTEIYDYFRIIMARLGTTYCPDCRIPVGTQTAEEITDKILLHPEGVRLHLVAPIPRDHNESYESIFQDLQQRGFLRMRIDGRTHELTSPPTLERKRKHKLEVVVDRVVVRKNQRTRLAESVEAALDLGQGVMEALFPEEGVDEPKWKGQRFSQHFACDRCERTFEPLSPNNFSFNAPLGWCPSCEGLGVQAGSESSSIATYGSLSLRQGAISIWPSLFDKESPFVQAIHAVCSHAGIPLDTPLDKLKPEHRRALFYGTGDEWIPLGDGSGVKVQYKGIFPAIGEAGRVSWVYRQRLADVVGERACPTCNGVRLRDDAAAVRFNDKTMGEWCSLPLDESLIEVKKLKKELTKDDRRIAGELLREIETRLQFLVDVGLHYLTLARPAPSLSGGEAQRIRLASQLGSGLTGVLYLLDEPTIGLHPRDNRRLLNALERLRDLGNTLVLVEHDREVIDAADYLVDFGPGAGRLGGTVVAEGPPKKVKKAKASLTGQYLSGGKAIPVPTNRRAGNGKKLEVIGASHHNLRRVDCPFPLGMLIAVTGVSGSGKSSLVNDVLWAALAKKLHRAQTSPGMHEEIKGVLEIDKVIQVDQLPLGATPASNPATYTGLFDLLRELYTALPDAKVRGYQAARFSFNRAGGRCEVCEGVGQKKIEMHFLPDVWIECDVCKGKRFNPETLAVKFKGKSIADVLDMTVAEALDLFGEFPRLRRPLQTLVDVGLDYMALGQSAPTLSGGEAQRVKLAAELARPNTGKTLYVLDEPTTGLHFDDLRKLLLVLHRLVDLGNTVIVIEHNLDVIKSSDWIIDVGPEAGEHGGQIVFAGTPEGLIEYEEKRSKKDAPSHTAVALKPMLDQGPHEERTVFDPDDGVVRKPGDKEFREVGKGQAMPWQSDGRQWHCYDRISHTGEPCKWDGKSLEWIVDELEKMGEFSATNWNDRGRIEIAAKKKSDGWFLHAFTNEPWMLRLKFRVAKGSYKAELLQRKLKLQPLEAMTEIPYYGYDPRVATRNVSRTQEQEVEITVHRFDEIDTPAFREFLQAAAASFLRRMAKKQANPESSEPWLADGEGWHFSLEGFGPNRRPIWDHSVLKVVMGCLEDASPEGFWDYASRDSIKRRFPGVGQAWARVCSKFARAVEINLVGPKGLFNLAVIDRFGDTHTLKTHNPKWDSIRFAFTDTDEISRATWTDFLAEHAEGFKSAFAGVEEEEE
jgi:excinuclease ABC subunit A